MLEECVCCGGSAPSWEHEEYLGWSPELTPEGEYLGIVCPGCFAGEGLAFLAVAVRVPALRVLAAATGSGDAAAERGPAAREHDLADAA